MTNKLTLIIITLALVVAMFIIFSGDSKERNISANNVEIKDGIQYVSISARGGYSPNVSKAKAGIPTKLIMNTDGTYDCSVALVIQSINYREILPQNGETEIDLGIGKTGEVLRGTCSMGMYNFRIEFE